MKNKLSLAVSALVLSSSVAFAANTGDSAFKEGKASGSLALYGEKHDFKDGVADSGFGNGNATVAFEQHLYMVLLQKLNSKETFI